MANTRSFCDQENHEHALLPPIVEVRDNLGSLGVQILATRENLAEIDYSTAIHKLYEIICGLHTAYDQERTNIIH